MLDPEFQRRFPSLCRRGTLIYYRWKARGRYRYQRLPAADDPNFATAYRAAVIAKAARSNVLTSPAQSAKNIRAWNARQVDLDNGDRTIPRWLLSLAREARKRAARRALTYTITRDQLSLLARRAGGACEVTGLPFEHSRLEGSLYRPFAPSLDRINPGSGYEFWNVRLTSVIVNTALNQWGEGPFWTMILAAAERAAGQTQTPDGANNPNR